MTVIEEAHKVQHCKKLNDLPCVATEWQQTTCCPDCEYYNCGACGDPARTSNEATCPFDGKPLRLLVVPVDSGNAQPCEAIHVDVGGRSEELSRLPAVERAVTARIVRRTGGRIQMLKVEVRDTGVVVTGNVSSYYLKQLVLEGVLEAVGADLEASVKLDVEVQESPPTSLPSAQ